MILKNYLKRVMPSLSSVVFVLVWFAIAPLVRAVVPAPDGGYPGFNTRGRDRTPCSTSPPAWGTQQLAGFRSGATRTGSYNTAVGAGTLLFNAEIKVTG